MDQRAREDIAAAAAVRRDLGRDYDDVLAESLVERIGEEIDKRVDARLGGSPQPRRKRFSGLSGHQPGRAGWDVIILALGSMMIGGITSNAILTNNHAPGTVVVIWLVILVINIAYARRR
jgi:hypothetical protein